MGAIDYWCNAFTPEAKQRWDDAIETQGIPLKIHREGDEFATPVDFLARMDRLEVDTVLLPSAEVPAGAGPTAFERFTAPRQDVEALVAQHPGRFGGLWAVDPTEGLRGVRAAAGALESSSYVGLLLHTHSWDRPFDDRDLYPFYALAAEHQVPMVVQAGTSGGLMPSECGRPIGIDRPALYFDEVNFVLSHTGWPWTDEALAMATKHPNVYLGTAAWPAHHWSAELRRFVTGVGQTKTLFGTSFPTVGHQQAISRLDELALPDEVRADYLEGNARRLFSRIAASS